jgi:hypothetical protein
MVICLQMHASESQQQASAIHPDLGIKAIAAVHEIAPLGVLCG